MIASLRFREGHSAGCYDKLAPLYQKFLYLSTLWAAKCSSCGLLNDALQVPSLNPNLNRDLDPKL